MSSTNDDIPFSGCEIRIRWRGNSVQLGEQVVYGGIDRSPGWTVLGPNSPYGAQLASPLERVEQVLFSPQMGYHRHPNHPPDLWWVLNASGRNFPLKPPVGSHGATHQELEH